MPAGANFKAYPLASVPDPWEGFNRSIYKFNTQFDRYVYLPVVRGYEYVMPDMVEQGVSNFFNNLGEIRNGLNAAMQLRGDTFGTALGRLMINTTLGIGGIFDIAKSVGIEEHREDFGQTLGRWGVGDGPYLVLPIYGPSNVRDTSGLVVDSAINSLAPVISDINELVYFSPAIFGLYAIDARHQVAFRYYQSGSPIEYSLVRFLYTKKRELDILK